MTQIYDLIIIGGGPAGYSAAVYAKRFNLKVLIVVKERGGVVAKTSEIENWPGEKLISGFELMQKMEDQVTALGVEIIDDEIVSIKKDNDEFILKSSDNIYNAKSILIATGTSRRKLQVPGENEFYGKGVSYCAVCDAAFFKKKIVGIVGGSDSAVKEAVYLTEFASKVYLIYRGEYPRAEQFNIDKMEERIKEGKIVFLKNTNVTEIKGESVVKKIVLDNLFNNSNELALDGLFIEIGAETNIDLAKQISVELNQKNEIIIDASSKTNLSGVFAAGDVTNTRLKQAIIASAQGVAAAFSAFEYCKQTKR